ncbi:MAG TPA: hypothetical protein VLE49_13690 [Anaerolineales bacterium]|nr:hypothetical protein [Anaerolineales bacterium]
MNEHPSPEFEKEIRDTFPAPGADPAFVHDLRATLLERAKMKKQTRSFYRFAWGLALAAVLVGLLVASPRVAEALKRLIGYVPGVGYVEQGTSLRVLSAPVTLEKDGVKLTIEKGAVDSGRTVLLEYLEGYLPEDHGNLSCETPARLVLPDGTILKQTQYETTLVEGQASSLNSYGRYAFEAMPAGQLQARLEIPCLMYDPDLTDFVFELHFEVADESQVMPVIELPTKTVENAPTGPVTVSASSAAAAIEGFSVVLASETPLEDGYVLSGSYQWTDPRFNANSVTVGELDITDANGQPVDFESVDLGVATDPAAKKSPFAYQITGKDHAYPLTLTVKSLDLTLPADSTFQFDAGADPQVGQKWDVNVDVPVREHILHVQTIELIAGSTPTQLGFTFNVTSDSDVTRARINDLHPIINGSGEGGGGGGGGGGGSRNGGNSFAYGWFIEGYSPAGPKTFIVSDITVASHGTWQTTWQPSAK